MVDDAKKFKADQKGKKGDEPPQKEFDSVTGMKVNRMGKLKSETQYCAEMSQANDGGGDGEWRALTEDGRSALVDSQVDTMDDDQANSVTFESEYDAYEISGRDDMSIEEETPTQPQATTTSSSTSHPACCNL